jgi:hypothetical protein
MSNEIHELSIDELDIVSGGELSTKTVVATVVAATEANQRYEQFQCQRWFGLREFPISTW